MGWVFYCGPICEEFAAEVPALEMAILRRIFFSHIFFEFLVFVAIIGKISSSSSQSRRKNWKIHWCGLFLAGRKCPGYLARARARARAPGPRVALGPPALLTIGDYDQRLFARAQLSKNLLVFWAILSRGSFFYFCVNFILFCLNCVQMFYNLFNFSRVFNLTLCVSAGKITQSWKKTRARAPLFKLKILVRSPGVV